MALYYRLIDEASREIVRLANTFTGYETAYDTRVLQDLGSIVEGVTRLLEEPDQMAQEFEADYRRTIRERLDRLETFGIPDVDAIARRQRLSVAYISLEVSQPAREGEKKARQKARWKDMDLHGVVRRGGEIAAHALVGDWGAAAASAFGGMASELLERAGVISGVDRALAQSRRLVVLGQAGSGKSTLMQWIAVRSASDDFSGALADWRGTVPFFIRLRQCVDEGFPPPEAFVAHVAPMLGGKPDDWVVRQLRSGRAVVLVDGVDEVPKEKRPGILDSLRQLVDAYPLPRYVITTRPAAVKENDWPEWQEWVEEAGFTEASLQPMNDVQIKAFLENWYAALMDTLPEAERREMEPGAGRLFRLLQRRPPLRRLAASPLLCAMICALYRESLGALPERRNRLYEQCVEMLLINRDERRGIALSGDYPNLYFEQRRELVQGFAYWMIRNGYTDVDRAGADKYFDGLLPRFNLPDATGEGVRRLLVERTSLLREPVEGRVDFTHRTFQEYLAARQAVEENSFGELLAHSEDDAWRELIILAVGEMRAKERAQFLEELLQRAKGSPKETRHKLFLLAVACLETAVQLDEAVRQQVLAAARELVPPKDEDEAKLVATAGDPAVDLLAYNPGHPLETKALCVRTLGLIGTEKAMHAIRGYVVDNEDENVHIAVGAAWAQFDGEEYVRVVFSHAKTIMLEAHPNPDLSLLAGLSGLQELSLYRTQVSDLAPLAALTGLQALSLYGTQVSDLAPLAALTGLRGLSLDETQVSDLAPLAALTGLQVLSLDETQVSDLAPLAALTALQELFLNQTQVSDLAPLTSLSALQVLELSQTQVSDLAPLAALTGLQALSLSQTQVRDLAPLAALTGLQVLFLDETQVSDLAPLAALTGLQWLYLSQTQVSDLTPLAALTSLQRLSLSQTQVSDEQVRALQAKLPKLSIRR